MQIKYRHFLLIAYCILANPELAAQPTNSYISTENTCSYSGDPSPENVLLFESDDKATEAVNRIVAVTGAAQNFKVRAAGITNAAAAFDPPDRYLLYNQNFMHEMKVETGSDWPALSVMAHEIGHHINNDTLQPKRKASFEIAADYFSGMVLQRLGASLEESQMAVQRLQPGGTETHPPRHDRLAAVANGWTTACAQSGCDKTASTGRTRAVEKKAEPEPEPEPEPKPKPRTGPNSCEYSRDGECDEPDLCSRGTDTQDCKAPLPPAGPLKCCDAAGRPWCQIMINPGPIGTSCWCAGVPGTGLICQ